MSMLLALHELARARGDGLAPALHDLLSRRARLIENNPFVVQLPTGLVQAGPHPAAIDTGFRPGNVVVLPPQHREPAATTAKSSTR